MKIRGAILVTLLALAAALLASCSSSGGSPKPSTSAATPQQRFVALLRTDDRAKSVVDADSDADLLTSGREVCDILAHPEQQNYSSNPIDDLIHEGQTAAHASAIVWAAKRELCPQPAGESSSRS